MPMPQYNGPTYGYNPYQTYLPQSPWQGPQPYTQPQTAQLPVQQVQTQANPPLVGHIVTANDQIPVGGTVTFNLTVVHTGCDRNGCGGSEYHRQGSGAVRLRGRGNRCGQASIFDLSFNGNVTSGTAGTEVQLAMTIDGTPLAETAMIETIGTANSYQNLAARTYLKVCPGEDVTLSVTNTGTEPVTIDANAAFTARRIA